jgi:hypothetical protein
MITDLYQYCESANENPNVKNKASAYEYLIKRYFVSCFNETKYTIDLFPIIEKCEDKEKFLTPDIEIGTRMNHREIKIVIEIKFFENTSINKKVARTKSRQRMNDYENAYRKKFPNNLIVPIFLTQNSSFDNNPNRYPCIVISFKELKENSQEKFLEINEIIQKLIFEKIGI